MVPGPRACASHGRWRLPSAPLDLPRHGAHYRTKYERKHMRVLRHKQSIIHQLRSGVGGIEPIGKPSSARPAPGRWVAPAIFTRGLHEIVGDSPANFTAATAFALIAAAQDESNTRPLFFATLASDRQERGQLYGHGVHQLGLDPTRILLLEAPNEKELLWAVEEAANSNALGGVIVALGRQEKLYGFPASRRLKLRQERHGVPLFIIRGMTGQPTAATARWRVACAPGDGIDTAGAPMPLLGQPRFRVVLERYAGMPPQEWIVELDETHRLRVAAPLSDRAADAHPIRAGHAA
jgi:protein ImuA